MGASWFNGRTWPHVEPMGRFPEFTTGRVALSRPFSFGSRALRKLTGKHHWEYLGKPVIRQTDASHAYPAGRPGHHALLSPQSGEARR